MTLIALKNTPIFSLPFFLINKKKQPKIPNFGFCYVTSTERNRKILIEALKSFHRAVSLKNQNLKRSLSPFRN